MCGFEKNQLYQMKKLRNYTTQSLRMTLGSVLLALMIRCAASAQTSDTTSSEVLTATPEKIAKTPAVLLYAELLGNGGWISLNCEVRLSQKLYLRGGAGFAIIGGFSFPLMLNYLIGNERHYFEIGAGIMFTSISSDTYSPGSGIGTNNNPTMTIGYRYMAPWFIFKAGWTPIYAGEGFELGMSSKRKLINSIGLSVGISL